MGHIYICTCKWYPKHPVFNECLVKHSFFLQWFGVIQLKNNSYVIFESHRVPGSIYPEIKPGDFSYRENRPGFLCDVAHMCNEPSMTPKEKLSRFSWTVHRIVLCSDGFPSLSLPSRTQLPVSLTSQRLRYNSTTWLSILARTCQQPSP